MIIHTWPEPGTASKEANRSNTSGTASESYQVPMCVMCKQEVSMLCIASTSRMHTLSQYAYQYAQSIRTTLLQQSTLQSMNTRTMHNILRARIRVICILARSTPTRSSTSRTLARVVCILGSQVRMHTLVLLQSTRVLYESYQQYQLVLEYAQ